MVNNLILGLAVGDAFGVPFEFMKRDDIRNLCINDMVGCDTPHNFNSYWSNEIPAGSWSDDTSLTIATIDSIINKDGNIDYYDIMTNFKKWWEENMFTSNGVAFGLGKTTDNALFKFSYGYFPTQCGMDGLRDNGNGSLMRISPFSMYCILNNLDVDDTVNIINSGSSLTHSHDISKMCCLIYTIFLKYCILTKNKYKAINEVIKFDYSTYYDDIAINENKRLISNKVLTLHENDIKQSGYVVDTLEAAIYSVLKGDNYESTLLIAVNLGYDTDTICAIAGSIAGVLYGYENIPQRWLNKLKRKEYLKELSNQFEEIVSKSSKVTETKKIK